MSETCLVIYCENIKAEGHEFCEHHYASPEDTGALRDSLAALEKSHARLVADIKSGDYVYQPKRQVGVGS